MHSRIGALLCAGLAVFAAGCNGDGGDRDGIEIAGATTKDQQIAADLRAYVERGCRQIPTLEQAREMIQHPDDPRGEAPPPDAARRYIANRYGSIKRAIDSYHEGCDGYRRIAVDGGVVTVETALTDDRLSRISARDICNAIQGSDVADFTPGHRVFGDDGEPLVKCTSRDV